ncbi:MAG: metallophosphatase family protein [Anaerolineae bacterium]|nr:metallophosphatase family protein [Anaerolineae bacterium]
MRILVISDIHANHSALEAVLEAAGRFDAVWCLGDLVGYGPDPNQVINTVRSLPNLICLLGNHDAAVINRIDLTAFNYDARLSLKWMIDTITPDNLNYLTTLPETAIIEDVLLAHGSPRNPIWEYILDIYTAQNIFNQFTEKIFLVGHSHIPLAFFHNPIDKNIFVRPLIAGDNVLIYHRHIFNPGSVGQPRDFDPRAAYAIYYPESGRWESYRVEYDYKNVQERILKAGLPEHHAIRLSQGV